MLNPHSRRVYLRELQPPDGYKIDYAVATTFSLDLLALLMAPVSMAIHDQESKEDVLKDPIALLEALDKTTDRFSVFCQQGRISVPANDILLYRHLEKVVVDVRSPNSKGVFHPKIWLSRYIDQEDEGSVFYRFLCLSRNLTFDQSWDTILTLEGHLVKNRKRGFSRNRPLSQFVSALPKLAVSEVSSTTKKMIKIMANEVQRVRFETPEEFEDKFEFVPIGIRDHMRFPKLRSNKRTLVMSPFVSPDILKRLTINGNKNIIISRLDTLEELKTITFNQLQKNNQFFFMDAAAEKPEETDVENQDGTTNNIFGDLSGLHAKLIINENDNQVDIITGSANATNAAFNGRNVEFAVRLTGTRKKVGINNFLGEEDGNISFRDMLREYDRESGPEPTDNIKKELEKNLEKAREALAFSELSVSINPDQEDTFEMTISHSRERINLPDNITGKCHPISLAETHSDKLDSLLNSKKLSFSNLSKEALTGFIAFRLRAKLKGQKANVAFVLNLPVSGMPIDRDKAILRSIISDKGKFIRYLLLILGGDDGGKLTKESGEIEIGNKNPPHRGFAGLPLFEELIRAFSRNPEKIDRVARLIEDIKKTDNQEELLPEGFDQIWAAILEARN